MPEPDYMELATRDVPERWYERHARLAAGAAAATGVGLVELQERLIPVLESTEGAIGAVALYLAGAAADLITTRKVFEAQDAANKKGIEPGYYEGALLMKQANSLEAYKKVSRQRRNVASELIFGAGVILNSAVALPAFMLRTAAAYNNNRKRKRIDRALELSEVTGTVS